MKTRYCYVGKRRLWKFLLFLSFLSLSPLFLQAQQEVRVTVMVKSLFTGDVDDACSGVGQWRHCNNEFTHWEVQAKTELDEGYSGLKMFPISGNVELGHEGDYYDFREGERDEYKTLIPDRLYTAFPQYVDVDFRTAAWYNANHANIYCNVVQRIPLNFAPNTPRDFTLYCASTKSRLVVTITYTLLPRNPTLDPYRILAYCADDKISLQSLNYSVLPEGLFYKWEYALESQKVAVYSCRWERITGCTSTEIPQLAAREEYIIEPPEGGGEEGCNVCETCEVDPGPKPSNCHTLVKTLTGYKYNWRTIYSGTNSNYQYFIPRNFGIMNGGGGGNQSIAAPVGLEQPNANIIGGGGQTPPLPEFETMLMRFSIVNASGYSITPYQERVYTIYPASPVILDESLHVQNISCFGSNDGKFGIDLTGNFKYTLLKIKDENNDGTPDPPNVTIEADLLKFPTDINVIKQEVVLNPVKRLYEVNNLAAGTYMLYLENYAGGQARCYTTKIITITEPLAITATTPVCTDCNIVESDIYTRCVGSSEEVKITVQGGVKPYSYSKNDGSSWDELQPDEDIIKVSLQAGTHTFKIKDKNGCAISGAEPTITLRNPSPIEFSGVNLSKPDVFGGVGDYNITCAAGNDGSIQIAGIKGGTLKIDEMYSISLYYKAIGTDLFSNTPFLTMSVSPTTRNVDDGTYSHTFTGLGKGFYKIVILDSYGALCASTHQYVEMIELKAPPAILIADADISHTVCFENQGNAFISFKATGGFSGVFTYSLKDVSNNPVAINPVINNGMAVFTGLNPGIYSLVATDPVNCAFTKTGVVIPELLQVEETVNIPPSCVGSSDGMLEITVKGGTGPYTYQWVGLPENGTKLQNMKAGLYTVQILDAKNCTAQKILEIKDPPLFVLDMPATAFACIGESITLDANYSGGIYVWRKGGNVVGNSQTITVEEAGAYEVTVTSTKGCIATHTINLEKGFMTVNLGQDVTLCRGQEITLKAPRPDCSYFWTSNNGYSSNNEQVKVKNAGTYYFKIITPTGCLGYDTIQVKYSNELLKADFLVSNISVVGDTVTAIDLTYPEPKEVLWEVLYNNVPVPITKNKQTYFDFIPSKEGWYTFRMTAYNYGCEDIKEKKIYVQDIGLNNPDAQAGGGQGAGTINDWVKEFSLYPNPNQGNFQCKVVLHEKASLTMMLYHASARQTMLQKQSGDATEHLIAFNESQLAKGMYFLILEIAGQRKMLRFVVY